MTEKTKSELSAPAHLSSASKQIWYQLVPSRARSVGRLALLQAALEARDRAEVARAEIAKVGLTTTTKKTGVCRLNPLVRIEKEARAQFAQIWSTLSLQWTPLEDGVDFEHWKRRQQEREGE